MDTQNCLCKSISVEEMNDIKSHIPTDETIQDMAEFFKIFGDGTRLKILYYLFRHELCVADLALLVKMQQSAISHQLMLLRLHRLVKYRKEGTTTYYSLADEHINSIFKVALEHLQEL
ncbi:MAG: metalloregulator ArsR/SmtB family transcription factor [Candidatus Cloacimonas sp.]